MHEVQIHLTVSKMARQGKTLAAKPDDLSSIPWTHSVEEGTKSLSCPLTFTFTPWHTCLLHWSLPDTNRYMYKECKNSACGDTEDRLVELHLRRYAILKVFGGELIHRQPEVLWRVHYVKDFFFFLGQRPSQTPQMLSDCSFYTACVFTVLWASQVFPYHRSSPRAWKRGGFMTSMLSEAPSTHMPQRCEAYASLGAHKFS